MTVSSVLLEALTFLLCCCYLLHVISSNRLQNQFRPSHEHLSRLSYWVYVASLIKLHKYFTFDVGSDDTAL